MKMIYEDGVVNIEGMEFDVKNEIQLIMEKSFKECIEYQLSEHPISVSLYKRKDQPYRITAQTAAFNDAFLVYATPLMELVQETIAHEDNDELQALRIELQTCMDKLNIRLKEMT